ncbi:MAG: zinc ribbon domain-containing protein [Candidatus Marinimicrobia bacterium]|jgi:putative FmdB family regulatory protein|nr:zinc ribbon domain-containing protein [Candidatus Neomarinimicrobiota bacterium]MBT3501719.1 zinc ribbon domain-containing protein [Candidatus Neomarinimicrobiota bacterium]MBT3839696.1 zinc ribbon domain-containing protein [Candidatus Neomarinimicrobiota bacterium]MBT3999104.1 zinc ribbon domain-containing protein [Candidatus Neomarinimicrobiota bacterium]MBT4282321.1 zinc ribbon domain-containing protein [Candidatus Neomarinimicrobiota bacterium]
MPMFDYHCQICDATFEELVSSHQVLDAEIKCPNCKNNKSKRMLSAPSISTNGNAKASPSNCAAPSGFS